jgi:hypothetical protein
MQNTGSYSFNGSKTHGAKAVDHFRQWMALRASMQKYRMKQLSIQAGVIAFFSFFVALWLEVALFLLLSAVMPSHWAAVVTLVLNAIVILIARALFKSAEPKAQAHLIQEAERERLEAGDELVATTEVMHAQIDRVVVPLKRYKVPVALGSTFVIGMLVAKAVLPDHQSRL